jgi:hypothetical protein
MTFLKRQKMGSFWVELKGPKKNIIVIIANGFNQASVLHFGAITGPGVRNPLFTLLNPGQAR